MNDSQALGDRKIRQTGQSARVASKLFTYCVLIFASALCLAPIVWVILSSFKTNAEIFSGTMLPTSLTLSGYSYALNLAPFPTFFMNSVFISTIAMLLNVTFVSMGAYIFARRNFRMKEVLFSVFMAAMVLPATALIQPVYMQIRSLGLINTRRGLILVYMCFGMPVGLMIMRSFFAAIPRDMEDSAAIDGAGFVRTFVQIIVPIAKPGIATIMVLRFLEYWNEFTYALVLTTSTNIRTMPLSLGYFVAAFSFNYSALFAAIVLSVLPALLLFAAFNESVVNSMTIGAVKG